MLVLTPPVEAPPTTRFDYTAPFAAHQHRGIDFPTTAGDPVRAPCTGRISFAGTVPTGEALTVHCRSFTVTLLGVAGAARGVERGDVVGAATGHELHLGVRRTIDRFGYIDPLPLLRSTKAPPSGPPPVTHEVRRRATPPRGASPRMAPALAPWPAWLGLALALTAATGLRLRGRRRVAPWHAPSTSRSSRPIPRPPPSSTSARSAGR